MAHSVIVCAGLLSAVWSYEQFIAPTTPIVYTGSDLYPKVARAGDLIEVTREFTVRRPAVVTVTRRLVRGDCRTICVTYDMDSSVNHLSAGKYTRTRVHQIPVGIKPGKYQLEFQLQWTNAIGKEFAEQIPPLAIEVVP